jgi:hypothetical protein
MRLAWRVRADRQMSIAGKWQERGMSSEPRGDKLLFQHLLCVSEWQFLEGMDSCLP